MDYLQYYKELLQKSFIINVLNLIINGLPSIQYLLKAFANLLFP